MATRKRIYPEPSLEDSYKAEGDLEQRLLIKYFIKKLPQQEINLLLEKGHTLKEILAFDYIASYNDENIFNATIENKNFIDYISGEIIHLKIGNQDKKNYIFQTPLRQMAVLAYKNLIMEDKSQEMIALANSDEDYKALAALDVMFRELSSKRRNMLDENKTIKEKCNRAAVLYMFQIGTDRIKEEIKNIDNYMAELSKRDIESEDIKKYREIIKNAPPEPDVEGEYGKTDKEYEGALSLRQNSIDKCYKLVDEKTDHKKIILGTELEELVKEVADIDKKNLPSKEDIKRLDEIVKVSDMAVDFYRALDNDRKGLNLTDNLSSSADKIKRDYCEYDKERGNFNQSLQILKSNTERMRSIFLSDDFFISYTELSETIYTKMQEASRVKNKYLRTIIDEMNINYQNFITEMQRNIHLRKSEFESAIKDVEKNIDKAGFFGKFFVNLFRHEKIVKLRNRLDAIQKIDRMIQKN